MASPAAKVFGVAELVEMILVPLPIKDLLLVQRVSRICRECVKSSSQFQQELFLKSGKLCGVDFPYETDFTKGDGIQSDARAKNKWVMFQKKMYLRRRHPAPMNSLFWKNTILYDQKDSKTLSPPRKALKFLHPAMVRLSGLKRETATDDFVQCTVVLRDKTLLSEVATAAPITTESSWRHMLVKQCPCTAVRVQLEVVSHGYYEQMDKTFAADVTMGEIMDWCDAEFVSFKASVRSEVVEPEEKKDKRKRDNWPFYTPE